MQVGESITLVRSFKFLLRVEDSSTSLARVGLKNIVRAHLFVSDVYGFIS